MKTEAIPAIRSVDSLQTQVRAHASASRADNAAIVATPEQAGNPASTAAGTIQERTHGSATEKTDSTTRGNTHSAASERSISALPGQTSHAAFTTTDSPVSEQADSTALDHTDSCALVTTPEQASATWSAWVPFQAQYTDGAEPLYRTVTDARTVFGQTSTSVPPQPVTVSQAHPLTGNFVFQGFVLLLAATYIMLLYQHLGDIMLLFSRISRTHTIDRLTDDPGGNGFSRFLNTAGALGLLFVGIAAVKAGDLLLSTQIVATLPIAAVTAMGASAILICLAIAAVQSLTVHAAGAIVLAQPLVAQLMYLKRIYFVLACLVATPVLLLFALCPPGTGRLWFYILVAQLVITTVLYLRESLHLFLSKKISILHWFLYLCTVEIFPISLLWLLAVR